MRKYKTKESDIITMLSYLEKHGEVFLYDLIFSTGMNDSKIKKDIDCVMLDMSDAFLEEARKNQDDCNYKKLIKISSLLRFAAHKVHYNLKKIDNRCSERFLHVIKNG